MQRQLPAGLEAAIAYDATKFINASIEEVVKTLAEAAVIVIVVIFLFLGNLRATLIPIVTIPLSLIGVMFALLALGYSINLLTLLALVLAIGLVVDDAIVVVENIYRHIEEGMQPFEAALTGAREIAVPVISMTITLAAVYAPIGFVSGLTGALFREFAFTLAGAVVVSGIIALTLSPMMASRLLKHDQSSGRFVRFLDNTFASLRRRYERRLHRTLNARPVTLLILVGVIIATGIMYVTSQKELAPEEDQGILFNIVKSAQSANLDYLEQATAEMNKVFETVPETRARVHHQRVRQQRAPGDRRHPVQALGRPRAYAEGDLAEPATQDRRHCRRAGDLFRFALAARVDGWTARAVRRHHDRRLSTIGPGARAAAGRGPAQRPLHLHRLGPEVRNAAGRGQDRSRQGQSPRHQDAGYRRLAGDAARRQLRQSLQFVRSQLPGHPAGPRDFRLTSEWINRYQVRTSAGALVPLSSIVTVEHSTQPNALTSFQQLNSAMIQGVPFPGRTVGEAIDFLRTTAAQKLPEGFSYDFQGESRQYVQEGGTLVITFVFALIIIYLVLAAQYESFRDPLIILIALPTAIFGALIPLNLGLATINIYTQVGLVTLIGLISKHGILMVDYANHLQENEGLDRRTAIERAAAIRLRPILMTTAAMVVGMIPLLTASGAGAASRFSIGIVIAAGMTIGTLFTLFVTPAVYTFVAREHRSDRPPAAAATPAPAPAE